MQKKRFAIAIVLVATSFLFLMSTTLASNLTTVESPEKPQEKEKEEKDKHTIKLVPGLVPYSDELFINGKPDFGGPLLDSLKKKCSIIQNECHDNNLSLFRGRVILNCSAPVHLKLPDASLDINPGATVYVYATGESVVILNLHDRHRHDVTATVEGEKVEIPPGREVLITRHSNLRFDEARLCPGIWYRSVSELISKPNLKVYRTQFSTVSALTILPTLHRMYSQDKRTSEKILKTYAAVLRVSRDPQPFRPCMSKQN